MISISKLCKRFDDHIIFDDLTLEINDNEFVVFSGKSGCGKTTLLNMIGGIESVTNGHIIVNDLEITKEKNLRTYYQTYVGFLFQNFALVESKTVEENLNMVQKKSRTDVTIYEALERVGLKGKEKQKVYSLSGGEQQRVALARLMIKKCDLILADEPTGSLDSENASKVMSILLELNQSGKTVIMVTHDMKYQNIGNRQIDLNALRTSLIERN